MKYQVKKYEGIRLNHSEGYRWNHSEGVAEWPGRIIIGNHAEGIVG